MSVKRVGKGLKELVKRMESMRKLQLKVGWFEGAKYKDGTPVAYVATIHEFGYMGGGIPPRPFMRPTIASQSTNWLSLGKSGAKAVLAGKITMRQVLSGIGLQASGDIKKTISQLSSPALDNSTVLARKRKIADGKKVGNLDKPLVETGLLVASINHEVSRA